VVDVGAAQHDRTQLLQGERRRLPGALAQCFEPLNESAVEQDVAMRRAHAVLGAGDRTRRSEEVEGRARGSRVGGFHEWAASSVVGALGGSVAVSLSRCAGGFAPWEEATERQCGAGRGSGDGSRPLPLARGTAAGRPRQGAHRAARGCRQDARHPPGAAAGSPESANCAPWLASAASNWRVAICSRAVPRRAQRASDALRETGRALPALSHGGWPPRSDRGSTSP
jgi:hypothetical protein